MLDNNVHNRPGPVTRYSNSNPPVFVNPKSAKFFNSVSYQSPLIWSQLPNSLKNIKDVYAFNREIKKLVYKEMLTVLRI